MTDIYTAIMKAADHSGGNPKEFDFYSCTVPSEPFCGTPGCAIGWIAAFAGYKHGERIRGFTVEVLGMTGDGDFYRRLDALTPETANGAQDWSDNPKECARALRLYAAKYHAPAKPVQQPPDWQAMAAVQTVATDVRSQDARVYS